MTDSIVICIEGSIGAGKTTLMNVYAQRLEQEGFHVVIIKEPVDEWERSGLLQLFYGDMKRWGFTFQMRAFHDRVVESVKKFNEVPQTSKKTIFISERSSVSDRIFMALLFKRGFVSELEFSSYVEICNMCEKSMPFEPSLFIYLRPPIDECMRRTNERNRDGESGVTIDYQEQLQREHDEIFNDGTGVVNVRGKRVTSKVISSVANFRDDEGVKKVMGDDLVAMVREVSRNDDDQTM